MSFSSITSLQNPRIKNLVRLREGNHRRRQKRFLIEGKRELERAIASGWEMEAIYFAEDFFRDEEDYALLDRVAKSGMEAVKLDEEVFRKAAYREHPDGWLASAAMRESSLQDLPLSSCPLLLVLEGVEKPGNLGAVIRSANAAGADAVIVSNPITDIYNPNAIRASQGAFFDLPVVETDNASLIRWLAAKQIRAMVATPHAEALVWQTDLTGPIAWIMGTEHDGVSEDWLQPPHKAVRLPMKGITDSLNVSTAAAVMLFETVRQRT